MVSELHKPTPAKDEPAHKPDAGDKHAAGSDKAQPSALHTDSHGADALDHQRAMRLQGEVRHDALPAIDLASKPIKHDGSAQDYQAKKGDTLSDIARKQLPPGASTHDIYAQVKEIARANHIANPDHIREGQVIHLPEHKAAQPQGDRAPTPVPGAQGARPGDAQAGPAAPHAGDGRPPQTAPAGDARPPQTAPAGDNRPPQTAPAGDARPPQTAPAGDNRPAQPAPAGDTAPPRTQPTDGRPAQPHDQTPAPGPAPTAEQHDAAVKTTVEALQKALGEDNPAPVPTYSEFGPMNTGPITDKHQIMALLGDKSPAQIKEISDAFAQAHGKEHGNRSLEDVIKSRLEGTDKDKAVDLFHRTNKADDPGRVHTALAEMHEWGGRSRANCEKDIRDTLATMNKSQIDSFKQEYQSRYGRTFDQDIAADSKISAETKGAIDVYSKGAENRGPKETQQLADIATKAKNLDMFQEAFRDASPEARTQYMANGGEAKMQAAFGGWFSNKDLDQARQYVKDGKLDTATKINENLGVFSSNKEAIDASIKAMSPAEREQYARGKAAAGTFEEYQTTVAGEAVVTTFNTEGYNKLSPAQKADYDKYRSIHEGLTSAGDGAKVARWEDMIKNGGETLVSRVADHGGIVSNDKVDKVISDIEGMNKGDFDKLKADPAYRKQVDDAIALNYSGDDLKRAQTALTNKLNANTFEESQSRTHERSTEQQMADKQGFWSNDRQGILNAVEKMTPEEQKRYRDEPQFRKDIDNQVASGLGGHPEGIVARQMLDRVAKGQPLKEDILDKMTMHLHGSKDKPAMLSEIEAQFKQDPTLRDRLANPKTDADKKYAADFERMGRQNFGGDYDKLVAPLVKDGNVPFAERAKLYDGWFSNDTKGLYESIGTASAADRKALADNPQKVLPFLTADQAALAGTIARQNGEMKPEDRMRAAILGESGDKDLIKEMGTTMKPEEKAQMVLNYQAKYGSNLTADLDGKLSGQDRVEAQRNFKEAPDSARAAFNDARDEDLRSNDGIGRAFVKHYDGTADMSRDDLNQYAAAMSGYARDYKEMPVEQSQKMSKDLSEAVDLYRKSKGAAADAVVDGAIIVGGVGVGIATGGVGLGVIGAVVVGGGALKVGAKAAIEGADYDSSKAGVDAITGGIDAGAMLVGPGEVAKILEIGGKAGLAAGRTALAEATTIAEAGGRQLFKQGAEATLGNEVKASVTQALAHGAKEIDQKTLQGIAEKYAASPEDVPAVKALLTKNLNEAVLKESQSAMRNTVREVALNSGAGAAGGGLSSGVRAAGDWDSSKSVGENLTNVGEQTLVGMGSGAVMGGGATVGFKALGKGFSAAREAIGSHLGGEVQGLRNAGEHSFVTPENVTLDRKGRVSSVDGANRIEVKYFGRGSAEGTPSSIEMANGTKFESSADGKWRMTDAANPAGSDVNGTVSINHRGEVEIKRATGDVETHFADGQHTVRYYDSESTAAFDSQNRLVAMKDRNGQTAAFSQDAEGRFAGAQYPNGRSVLSEDGGQTWKFKNADGSELTLNRRPAVDDKGELRFRDENGDGHLLKPDGSLVDYTGGKFYNPKSITYADGGQVHIKYDGQGHISELTNPDGSLLRYNKDESVGIVRAYDHVAPDGTVTVGKDANLHVGNDGTIRGMDGESFVRRPTDGRVIESENYDGVATRETLPAGYDRSAVPKSADGRPLEGNQKNIDYAREKFAPQSPEAENNSIRMVQRELRDVKATGPDGKPTSAYDSLMADRSMSDAQKESILKNLSAVREHFASYRVGDRMHPDPEVNWIHTQGEMAKVLEAGRAKGLSGEALHDTVLASMYSDSIKFAAPPPDGASANFLTHHLDGALAAERQLKAQGLPPERVDRIIEAIKAHQIAPPELMGEIYRGAIGFKLGMAIKEGKVSAEEGAHLQDVLNRMTVVGEDGKSRLRFMADINNAPKEIGPDGHMEVALSADERKVLSFSGTDKWNVPYDPKFDPAFKQMSRAEQTAALSRRDVAQTLIDGDGIDNYATTGGGSKIVAIRGPETNFKDKTIFDSIKSIDTSYKDAYAVMSPEARKIGDRNFAAREGLSNYDKSAVKTEMEDWLRSQGRDPSKPIPFYNSELKYPDSNVLAPGERNLPGLNDQQMKDFTFAKEMRAKMVELLRADHRTGGDLPGTFDRASKLEDTFGSRTHFLHQDAEPLKLPGRNPKDIEPGESYRSPDGSVSARRAADGSLVVEDATANTTRHFDSQNRLVSSENATVQRRFEYGVEGDIVGVTTVDKATNATTRLQRYEDGTGKHWQLDRTGADGKAERLKFESGKAVVDADGTVKIYDAESKQADRFNADGSYDIVKASGRIEYKEANFAREKGEYERSIQNAFAGNPARLQRMEALTQEFEKQAASQARDLTENERALLYKQINRLLADNPSATMPLATRADLAEQVMNHSAHPATVDQGQNSTCQTAAAEHRVYWRQPDKNAQVVADAALTGHYRYSSGREIDLRDASGQIKPDAEARDSLNRMNKSRGDGKKADGSRDFASQIVEIAMVNERWANTSETLMADGRMAKFDDTRMQYDANGKVLGIVNSDHFKMLDDENGRAISKIEPGGKYYIDGKLVENLDPARVLYSPQGYASRYVDDVKNIQQIFDSTGKPYTRTFGIEAGERAYDKDGKLLFLRTRPGDLHYDKTPGGPLKEGEQVWTEINGRRVAVKDQDNKAIDSPDIHGGLMRRISNEITGENEQPFLIGNKNRVGSNELGVKDTDEFVAKLKEMQGKREMPIIMSVNAHKPPFNSPVNYEADNANYAGHLINVHDVYRGIDPATGMETDMVHIVNTWGSGHDYMAEKGVPASVLFAATERTPDRPPIPAGPAGWGIRTWNAIKRWF